MTNATAPRPIGRYDLLTDNASVLPGNDNCRALDLLERGLLDDADDD